MDTYAFASLAHVRILLVPVGSISSSSFEKYAAEIRSFESVRLGDIPADHKDERARFMPGPLSTGHLHLSFPTHPPPRSHLPLSLLRPSHFPLAVIGVATCSQNDSLSSVFAQFNSSLLDIFPSDGIYPLARNCFVFEEGEDTSLSIGDNLPGLFILPSMMGNKRLYLGTLLADLCSQILGEFGVLVQALESPMGNEYLNSALLPTIPPLSEIPEPLNGLRKDSLPPLPSHNSQPDMTKGNFTLSAAPIKRTSSGPGFRQASVTSQPVRKRLSTIGVASSHARLFKVLGDLFLLSGRPEDALVWYIESLQLFKSSQDHVWHAATLEGLATVSVIESWSVGNGLQNSLSGPKEPWAETCDKLIQATALYFKSPTSEGDPNYSLLSYLYASCVLRHSSFLFAIWSAKGWGPLALTAMLQPGPKPYLPPTLSKDGNSWAHLERLSSVSGISRGSIASILSQIHGPWLLHLGAGERIAILEATSGLYACLGYRRKEAYILREVLGCILDLIVCGREEDGLSRLSSLPGTSGLGIQGMNSSSGGGWGSVGVRVSESTDGNDSILELLKYVCKVLGINLDAVKLVEVNPSGFPSVVADENTSLSCEDYDNETFESMETYGWPDLQVGVVREAVAVAEALPDFPTVAQFALSALKTLQTVLSPGDQYHLYSTSARALATAQRRGDTKSVEYWSGRPVVSITLAPIPLPRLPVEKPISALQPASSAISPILAGGTDPFLYNPRRVAFGEGKTLVVQRETLEFVAVLQNPYIFDLELQSLSLSTTGVPFESRPLRVVIPANSFHEVVLSGKALETGTLTIRGCRVQAPGGASREFMMPLLTSEEEQRLSRKKGALACEVGRSKYSGMESFPWKKSRKQPSRPSSTTTKTFRFMECTVVPEQPLLRIRRTSLTHGALMLYNGEQSTIRITLENVSPVPIDFLRLVFDDSTIAPAQQALSEGQLTVFETYETEYSLIQRPVFSWNQEEVKDIHIRPSQKITLSVTCIGKVGCIHGTIHCSYSYVHREPPILHGSTEIFHVRQLSFPVMVTVYHMLECHALDILPFPHHTSSVDNAADERVRARRGSLYVDDEASWCLFSIEVRNTYGSPFDVTFERSQKGAPPSSVSATVPPGSMSRLVIPIQKFVLPEEQLTRSIPTLSDRQFVVQKSKLSDQEARSQRELFWYREELFKIVRGTWRETGGTRFGELSLRQQRMTLPMLETLRLENARVHLSLVTYNNSSADDDVLTEREGKFYPPAEEFVYLRSTITNTSSSSQVFIMDMDLEPSEHIVFEGVLSELAVGRLESGETREIDTAICFLSKGRFEISAEVRSYETPWSDTSRAGIGHLIAIVRSGDAE